MDQSWASAGLSEISFSWNGRGKQEITCPSINLQGLWTQFVKKERMQWDLWPCRAGETQIEGSGVQECYIGVWDTCAHLLTVMTLPSVCSLLSSLTETFWTFLLIYSPFILKWSSSLPPRLMTLPSLGNGSSLCILCNCFLTLTLFCLTWLLALHFYLWHYILSFLGTRTVSYLY